MDTYDTVMAWDGALRRGEWEAARSLLSEDATWTAPNPEIQCDTPEEIIDLLRSFKGINPDVELRELQTIGPHGLARLFQPAWDQEWFQVLTVRKGRICRMEDFEDRAAALAASGPDS